MLKQDYISKILDLENVIILTDPAEKKVLDILPNRFEQNLIHYFNAFKNRSEVKFFVTDMNPHFKAVAKSCFPSAAIIADRYHVIRQVIWAMERRMFGKMSRSNCLKNSENILNALNLCSINP